MKSVIWWIRRDLRVTDNPALRAALELSLPIQPIFILDPRLYQQQDSPPRQDFYFQGLIKLDQELRKRGNYLLIRAGVPEQVLPTLFHDLNAETVFAEEDYTPFARKRDINLESLVPLKLVPGLTAFHPEMVHKADGNPYTVYTPYMKAWRSLSFPCGSVWDAPNTITGPTPLENLAIPYNPENPFFPAGEAEAAKRLENFLAGPIFSYRQQRDFMAEEGTSTLSPYLHFGMISICRLFFNAQEAYKLAQSEAEKQSVQTWMNELIWREFYNQILYHYPLVASTAFQEKYRAIPWREAPQDLIAWQQGLTGFPIVDAAMRQLDQTGWMHNRARMIVASFLTKDLLINWQHGERWFMDHLIDADLAANNGGWQWTAGVGTDAAPYFRIFNPTLQSKKFDPQGSYIRRWVPELSRLPDNLIHQPELMSQTEQSKFACSLGVDYPFPIVDRKIVQKRTLAAYQASKSLY